MRFIRRLPHALTALIEGTLALICEMDHGMRPFAHKVFLNFNMPCVLSLTKL